MILYIISYIILLLYIIYNIIICYVIIMDILFAIFRLNVIKCLLISSN